MRLLEEAKSALITFAAMDSDLTGSSRPGDLPCPDRNNDGTAETSCGSSTGSNQSQRLGRLPWQTLKTGDLRDYSGERLWYAVSNNFKNNTRRYPLNSDTEGTITVRDYQGNVMFDGSATPSSGVVAVIIAPGPPIKRQDGLQQQRTGDTVNDPRHYLDTILVEDNADFDEISNKSNGFFNGPVFDPNDPNQEIANDRLIYISQQDIMQAIEGRVAVEVLSCMKNYAAMPENGGRYPWAADLTASSAGDYSDQAGLTVGRIPDLMCASGADLANTDTNDFTALCAGKPLGTRPGMLLNWGSVPDCKLMNSWFANNWREQVFYAIGSDFQPSLGPAPTSCGACLKMNAAANAQVAVMVAGKANAIQSRSSTIEKADLSQYLEDINKAGGSAYVTKSTLPTFNDRVMSFPTP